MAEGAGPKSADRLARIASYLGDPENRRRARGAILSLALLLRLAWALAVPVVPVSDSVAYDTFAQNIAAGNGYGWTPGEPSAYWPVGTAALYSALYLAFGHSYAPIVALNIAIGVLIVGLTMSLARQWSDELTSFLAGLLLSIWPSLIQFTTILASELLFLFFVLVATWCAELAKARPLPRSLLSGLALAAASYIRPISLLLVPFLFLRALIRDKRISTFLLCCIVAGLSMFAALLPWSLRNMRVFEHFVLVSTNGGANFWMGNNPDTTGGYMPLPDLGIGNEAEQDRAFNKLAIAYIREKPLQFLSRTVLKALKLHDRETIGIVWNRQGIVERYGNRAVSIAKLGSNLYWYLVLALGLLGAILELKRKPLHLSIAFPPLYFWAYFILVHCVTVVNDRYHFPSIPFIAIFAAYALNFFVARRTRIAES